MATATIMDEVSKYVSVEATAKILKCTDSRVRQLLRSGELPGVKVSDRVWVILRKDAEKYAKIPQETGRPRKFFRPA